VGKQHISWAQMAVLLCVLVWPAATLHSKLAAAPSPPEHGKHFDRVIVIVLENEDFSSAANDSFLSQLAKQGASFSNFRAETHPSYPNYLAMIAGSTFGVGSDSQKNFPDDDQHRTIANLMEDWKHYAEEYPAQANDPRPFLGGSRGKYARKHVPFLSFLRVQQKSFHNVASVNTHDTNNVFVSDIAAYKRDAAKNPLPRYMFYSPNLDDDGHDSSLATASQWLKKFLNEWLKLDDKLKGTLVVVTFDESESHRGNNQIYTVFLGDMIKAGQVDKEYNHYSVLRTIEDNFGFSTLNSGDGSATPIDGIWK